MIPDEKLKRLTCTDVLGDEILGGFINRQLVSTNQAVKETANALSQIFGEKTKIVYSKAGNVSEFRHNNGLVKSREVNNLHHAHDAYLNIVVGNVWDSEFGSWVNYKQNKNGKRVTFNNDNAIERLFSKDRSSFKVNYLEKIKDYLFDNKKYLNKFVVTKKPYELKGEFYDQTIHTKGKGQYLLHETKNKNGEIIYSTEKKYGGYKTEKTAYNCFIEYDKICGSGKNKRTTRVKGIFGVPVRFVGRYKDSELLSIIANENEINRNPKMILPKILMFSVLEIDGVRYLMRSKDLQCSVTMEWQPEKEIFAYVHDIFKYKTLVDNKEITIDDNVKSQMTDIEFATRERSKKINESKKISKDNNLKLFDAIIAQVKKPIYKKIVDATKFSRENFENLATYTQMKLLVGLLKYVNCGEITVGDMTAIGGTKTENAKCKFNNIHCKNIRLITQSPTGLFEKAIPLNEV